MCLPTWDLVSSTSSYDAPVRCCPELDHPAVPPRASRRSTRLNFFTFVWRWESRYKRVPVRAGRSFSCGRHPAPRLSEAARAPRTFLSVALTPIWSSEANRALSTAPFTCLGHERAKHFWSEYKIHERRIREETSGQAPRVGRRVRALGFKVPTILRLWLDVGASTVSAMAGWTV